MHKSITPETFSGLNWNTAKLDFDALAEEYGRSVSAAAFDAWCAKHSPSSIDNAHRWHSGSSIRRFLAEFENEDALLKRLVAIENARRKGKLASRNAYDASGPAKKKRRNGNRDSILDALGMLEESITEREKSFEDIRDEIAGLVQRTHAL